MGDRADSLRTYFGGIRPSFELMALLEILEVQEEILEELRFQNTDEEEEAGPTSLSDR